MNRNLWILLVVHSSLAALLLAPARAQQPFYQGKTIRIIVGASAGGGYDTYSRTLARHMGKHIPGNPTLVVENMPGAGFFGDTEDVVVLGRDADEAEFHAIEFDPGLAKKLLEK